MVHTLIKNKLIIEKTNKMKLFKIIIPVILLVGVFASSCTEECEPVYPGTIIQIDTVFVEGANLTYPSFVGSPENLSDDRFYAFSGSSSEDFSSFLGEDWTYELWIKVDADALIGDRNAESGAAAGGACISERGRIFELYLIDDANADYAIKYGRLDADNLHTASMQSDNSNINLNFDEWAHIAITRSSSDGIAKFYINGKLIDSSNDVLWAHPSNDTWLDFNYMYRGGNINFFKGSMDNIRVSRTDRYPNEFEPDYFERFSVDDNTFLQLDLDNNLTPFDPVNDFDKVEIKGTYPYYIKIHNRVYWTSEDFIIPST